MRYLARALDDAIVDEDIWGFIGFRRYATSGVTNFDVEFNRQQNAGGSTYLPLRSVGDVMVRFEQDGNKGFKLTNAYFWRLQTGPDWTAGCLEVSGYSPGAGWCPVDIAQVPFTGTTGEDGHFGEGAFNFTALLELGGGDITCLGGNFGTMNIRTFTGNADQSALKDYVDAVSIDVGDTCGAMEIYKVDQFGNSVPGATFSISPNPIPGESASPLVITDGGPGDPDGTADGAIVIDPASPGTYTVVETAAPAGSDSPTPEATFAQVFAALAELARFDAELFELAVQVGALQTSTLRHACHAVIFATQMIFKINALELVTRFAQWQIQRDAA